MRKIRSIVCHHTASNPSTTPDEIRGWHVNGNGWSDIGYHWVVFRDDDGDWLVEAGRPEARSGAHAKGKNADTLGIVVSGDYTKGALPELAEMALAALVAAKCVAFGLNESHVFGHSEVMAKGYTVCPGYDMDRVRARVAGYLAARK